MLNPSFSKGYSAAVTSPYVAPESIVNALSTATSRLTQAPNIAYNLPLAKSLMTF
jgi:hypothetical protein